MLAVYEPHAVDGFAPVPDFPALIPERGGSTQPRRCAVVRLMAANGRSDSCEGRGSLRMGLRPWASRDRRPVLD